MEYDPDRALWVPGRRSFLFLTGAALAGTILPKPRRPIITVDMANAEYLIDYSKPFPLTSAGVDFNSYRLMANVYSKPFPTVTNVDVDFNSYRRYRTAYE